ncbi:ribosomal-protein-alanine N-acetyltransferase [Pontibacter ummariensis]|uniref:Ribosomal-protein-alanine N-acetyltransferase n=1 Tax=Pontibacter ummariensis TaxID=1610492 RepID=A0A239L6G6_9BACT|nr:GNAT family N-acetyltransferase [Pontibacter ummariensis]PRY04296.1 ribosomal-protein-alanine N-acetyltransferase [Pontibacter ummariensis]SNT25925.1 ribosomal-protein-alanine N-acetyltransferase [Pontibacter ummariensis]
MGVDRIITDRLILIPFSINTAVSILEQNPEIFAGLGLQQTSLWPDQEAIETLPKIIRNLELVGDPTGFESWMVVLKSDKTVIGDAGFKGRPNKAGEVDLGYAIIEQEQRKGYGMEVARALTEWALEQQKVNSVTAKCFIGNTGSARILQKLGMTETHRDEEMIYWQIKIG